MATKKEWFAAIKVRSLPCFFAPVLIACGYSYMVDSQKFSLYRGILAAVCSVVLQIGLNLTNDYQEGRKGVDTNKVNDKDHMVAASFTSSKNVLYAALFAYFVSGVFGIWLIIVCHGWWLILVGIISYIVSWTYTGGPWPYGYHKLGEATAFLFPGPVALLCTIYTQGIPITWAPVLVSISLGLFSCSVLMNDNLRDIRHDPKNNKITLAVAIGDKKARILYGAEVTVGIILTLIASISNPFLLVVLLVVPLYYSNVKKITFQNVGGSILRGTLDVSGQALIIFSVLATIGFALHHYI